MTGPQPAQLFLTLPEIAAVLFVSAAAQLREMLSFSAQLCFMSVLLLFILPTASWLHRTVSPSHSPIMTKAQSRTLFAMHTVLISDYMRMHNSSRHTAPRLVYRLALLQPGLGDRLTGLLYSYILAALSGRVLLLDWQRPFDLSDLLLSSSGTDIYYRSSDAALERERSVRHCLRKCPFGDLRPFAGKEFTVVFNHSLPLKAADVVRFARRHAFLPAARALVVRGGLENGTLSADRIPEEAIVFGRFFKAMLRPSPKMEQFMETYAGPLMRKRYVSIHARLGTGVREGGPRFEDSVGWERVASCLSRKARKMARRLGVDGTLFLATDTPAFRETFRRAVVKDGGTAEQVLFGTWGTKHFGWMHGESEDDLQLFKFSIMELLLLGKGEGMVSTVSRYSTIGSFVGGITERELVVPEKDC